MLQPSDLVRAVELAQGRNRKEKAGVRSKKYDEGRSEFEIHLLGILGELAVADLFGVPIDETVGLTGDGGFGDVQIAGFSVAVKYRTYSWGDLFFNTMRDFKDDIAVLVTAGPDLLTPVVRGWATRDYFEANAETMNFGYGTRLVLLQARLLPIDSLVALHRSTAHVATV